MRDHTKKKGTPPADFNALLQAVKAVFIGKKAKTAAAREFKLSKNKVCRACNRLSEDISDFTTVTDETLLDYLQMYASTTPSVFTQHEEKDLIKYIAKSSEQSYNLSSKEVRTLAYKYAVKNRIHYPESWGIHQMAGREWFYRFMKRNENLSLCTPDEIDDKYGTVPEMDLDTVLSNDIDKDEVIKNITKENDAERNVDIKNPDTASSSKACVQEIDPLDHDTTNQLLTPLKVQKQSDKPNVYKRKSLNSKKMPPAKKSH